MVKGFADYKKDAHNWITLATGEYYPDALTQATELYKPVLNEFARLLKLASDSRDLFIKTAQTKDGWLRVQLARVFRKYVSPDTPVEMLKKKTSANKICDQFGTGFRPLEQVREAFASRSIPDEALCAILWEYKDRGKKGYDLTEKFFDVLRKLFPEFIIIGPERAGKDVLLGEVFKNYPHPDRPVDFMIADKKTKETLVIGLARYDSDRGGAQEDDRTGGYKNCADEILNYAKAKGLKVKVLFLNDGPGLLLGSMWDDYASIETRWPEKILVVTLKMVAERVTKSWILN